MSQEIHDWLAELHGSDPAAARAAGQALLALMTAQASLGPPLVRAAASVAVATDPVKALDLAYECRLDRQASLRATAADAAALARDIGQHIGRLRDLVGPPEGHAGADQPTAADGDADDLAAIRSQLADLERTQLRVRQAELALAGQVRQAQQRADAHRARKEVLKARYTAARTIVAVEPSGAAAADLAAVTADIEADLAAGALVPGLMELCAPRAGGSEASFLFAAEPPGAALVIAVLADREAVAGQYLEAAVLASEELRRVRAGLAPEAAAVSFEDPGSFLREFFPDDAADVAAGAETLATGSR